MPPRSGPHSATTWKLGFSPFGRPVSSLLARLPAQGVAGRLVIRLPSGHDIHCDSHLPGPQAHIDIRRWRGLRRILTGGSIGLGQAFMDGDFDCPDLLAVFEWGLANEAALGASGMRSWLMRCAAGLHHRRNENSLSGSRRNIAAHYDLGNDFYATWLDAGMSYSSALYTGDAAISLEAAQEAKLDRVVELLDLSGRQSVLEVGCGWGALAERIMSAGRGTRVTGLTLSRRQLDFAIARPGSAHAPDGADLRLQDHREVNGIFDRIVSIEMLEAVGQRYWPTYFETLRRRLAPGGVAVLQVITIKDERFPVYVREPDFIQHYIFPGGMLPSITVLREDINRAGLRLDHLELFGASYARTLAEWRARFQSAWPQLRKLDFDERFRRMWLFYLTYCEAGFRGGELDVGLYRIKA